MEVLTENRKYFTLMGILPPNEDGRKWIKYRNYFIGFFCFSTICGSFVSTVCFASKFIRIDLELSLYALLQMGAFGGPSYLIIMSSILWRKFSDIFPKLQQIYDECWFIFSRFD